MSLWFQNHLLTRHTDSAPPWVLSTAGGARDPLRTAYARYLNGRTQHVTCPLSSMLHRWESLVHDVMVLNVIRRGHEIPFKDGIAPPFNGVINSLPKTQSQALVFQAELNDLISKGAVTQVPAHLREDGFYSHYFLVPKRDGGMRPILNLKPFNKSVKKISFKMIKTPSLLAMVRQTDFLTSIDLKDAFFHCPVAVRHRKYLRFCYRGESFQYNCLPFGYRLSPITFTRCVKAALGVLLRKGLRIAWYLDDLLVLAQSPEQSIHNTLELMEFLKFMGFNVNWKKSAPWPACQASYLGLRLDTVTMIATITPERWEATRRALQLCVPGGRMRYKMAKRLLGLLASAHQVVPLGLLFMRRLQLWFAKAHKKYGDDQRHNNKLIWVPTEVSPDLDHWNKACADVVGVPMGPRGPEMTIYTDASLSGWGAVMGYNTARGVWPQGHKLHINVLEMMAIWLALQQFAPSLRGRHILIMTDSVTAKAYINRQGGLKSEQCRDWARRIWLWVSSHALSIRALHVPGENNEVADILSRGGPHADNWSLNPGILGQIWDKFGEARVDLFASKVNAKCPLWYSLSPTDGAPLGASARTGSMAGGAALRVPSLQVPAGAFEQVHAHGGEDDSRGPVRGEQRLVSPDGALDPGRALRLPAVAGRSDAGQRADLGGPLDQGLQISGMDAYKARLLALGLCEHSVEVMQAARKCTTNSRYQGYWKCFVAFCARRRPTVNPYEADIVSIIRFVEECRRSRRWTFSSVKLCVSAITAFRGKIGDVSVFTHPLMKEYLRGADRLSADRITRAEVWDASLVLRALQDEPFEPMATAEIKWVSAKLAVLLALTTAARGSELAALTIRGLVFSTGDVMATVYPDPAFVPKTVTELYRRAPMVIRAFHPSPVTGEEERLHLLCPVRALRCYLERTSPFRQSDRLLVTYAVRRPGFALSSQRLAHWLVDGITEAYVRSNKPAPRLTAHSTRGTAVSIAVLSGVDWEVVRQAAAWLGDRTFLSHYFRNTAVNTVAEAVLRQAC